MSFNNKSKEDSILERQRDIAMIRAAAATEANNLKSNHRKPPPPASNPPANRTLSSLTGLPAKGSEKNPIHIGDASSSAKPSALKRARPKLKTETALAQARQRVNSSADESDKPTQEPPLKRPSVKRPSIRNPLSSTAVPSAAAVGPKASGSLSSILLSNQSTAKYLSKDAPKLLKHYPKVEPNDYWKNLRHWDFIRDLNEKMGENRSKRKADDTPKHKVQPLPDAFASHREYCALWSPLIMIETRAQLLSDAISDIPYWKSKDEKRPVRVRVEVRKRDLEGERDAIGLVVKEALGDISFERTFLANDVICLVCEEKTIWDGAKGVLLDKEKGQSSSEGDAPCCIVGHIEHTRRSIENLVITISRKIWKQIGRGEMTLLKIGCNITSLREFTALCRMDRLPLADYILCNKMNVEEDNEGSCVVNGHLDPEKEKQAKKEVLQKMGGPIALGKGFVDYARQKFNLSQLKGISASAAEYGNGGFTLVSGLFLVFYFIIGNSKLVLMHVSITDQRSTWYRQSE